MVVASTDARLELVTVYARGARVRRVTELAGPIAPRVRIGGLPAAVIDDTVRVELDGAAVATTVRVGVESPPADEAAAEDTPEVRAAHRRVAVAEAEAERLGSALDQLTGAPIVEPDPSDDPPASWDAVVRARRAVIALRAERELALRDRQLAARRELAEALRALEAATDRDRRAGTARPAKLHELRKYVELEVTSSGPGAVAIHVEYLVAAARWAPSYVARVDGDRATVELRAVVAQHTGEDWAAVPLRLSTAEPARFAALPELPAQLIGRPQHEPQRAGFRAPPSGADALYVDYDRELRPIVRARLHGEAVPRRFDASSQFEDGTYMGRIPDDGATASGELVARAGVVELADEVWDEESSRAKEAFHTPASGVVAPTLPPAPAQPLAFRGAVDRRAPTRSEPGGAVDATSSLHRAPAGKPVEPALPAPRLDYGNLRMAPPSSRFRGQLIAAAADRAGIADGEVTARRVHVDALGLPAGCTADWAHTYDYAFATDGAIDVRADGGWHSIAVTAKPSTARVHHVTVPRAQADVFRIAAIANPFAGPLLPGPIDVYDRGHFLVTTTVDYTPPGATVEIGLGVDPAVKIARNIEFREEVGGMLRGALKLIHAIAIDVTNVSGRAIDLEIRERIPVTRDGDDEVEVAITRAEPAWERWTPDPDAPKDRRLRGGHRWRIGVPAGQTRTVRASYEVKIAGKLELVGGNRRES